MAAEILQTSEANKYPGLNEYWQAVLDEYYELNKSGKSPKEILEGIGISKMELRSLELINSKITREKNAFLTSGRDYSEESLQEKEEELEHYNKRLDLAKTTFSSLTLTELLFIYFDGYDEQFFRYMLSFRGIDELNFYSAKIICWRSRFGHNPESVIRTYNLIQEMKNDDELIVTNIKIPKNESLFNNVGDLPNEPIQIIPAISDPNTSVGLSFRFNYENSKENIGESILFDNPLGLLVKNSGIPVFWASFIPDSDNNCLIINQIQGRKGLTQKESSLMDYGTFLIELIGKYAINNGFETIKIRPAKINPYVTMRYEDTGNVHAKIEQLYKLYDLKAKKLGFQLDGSGYYSKIL
jgi:hypothetical protein